MMISCKLFYNILKKVNFNFFTGIPDSTFKNWISFLVDHNGKDLQNIIASNECEAIALCAGYHLATNKIGIVYMQNSGLGKAINPLTSLCDKDVYSIPILLFLGWRGEPGKNDAQQHKKMGRIMLPLLDTLEIPYSILEPNVKQIEKTLKNALNYLEKNNSPYAIVLRKNFFDNYELKRNIVNNYELTREEALNLIMKNIKDDDIVISTTGFTSRELFEYREANKKDHYKSFYNIGSMGCASSIGLSIAIQRPERKIFVFDGDGAAIMQLGVFTTVGNYSPSNFIHIIFDNHAHESTGGQPTNSHSINFLQTAIACNYKSGIIVKSREELINALNGVKKQKGPFILVIKIKKRHRTDLGRLNKTLIEYKEEFKKNFINN